MHLKSLFGLLLLMAMFAAHEARADSVELTGYPFTLPADTDFQLAFYLNTGELAGSVVEGFPGTEVEISGFYVEGSEETEAFAPFILAASAATFDTPFDFRFALAGQAKLYLTPLDSPFSGSSYTFTVVDGTEVDNTVYVGIVIDNAPEGPIEAGTLISITGRVVTMSDPSNEETYETLTGYNGSVVVAYTKAADEFGLWELYETTVPVTSGQFTAQFVLTSVLHGGVMVGVSDVSPFVNEEFVLPASEVTIEVLPGVADSAGVGGNIIWADSDTGDFEGEVYIVIFDEFGNYVPYEGDVTFDLVPDGFDISYAEIVALSSGVGSFHQPQQDVEEEPLPQEAASMALAPSTNLVAPTTALASPLAPLEPAVATTPTAAALTSTSLVAPYAVFAQTNAMAHAPNRYLISGSVGAQAAAWPFLQNKYILIPSVSVATGTVYVVPRGVFQLNGQLAIATNRYNAKLAISSHSVGQVAGVSSSHRAFQLPQGTFYSYTQAYASTSASKAHTPGWFQNFGSPLAFVNGQRLGNNVHAITDGSNFKGLGSLANITDNMNPHPAGRGFTAEVTYDLTKIANPVTVASEIRPDIFYERGAYAYSKSQKTFVDSAARGSVGVAMSAPNSIAKHEIAMDIEAKDGINWVETGVSVSLFGVGIPIKLPQTITKRQSGSKKPVTTSSLSHTHSGTLATFRVAAAVSFQTEADGSYALVEPDLGLFRILTRSKVSGTFSSDGLPAVILGSVDWN